jgi:hypothetical protein
MRNAVIGVILAGFAAWVGLAYLGVGSGPRPWDLLPPAIRDSPYGVILAVALVGLLWQIWDRFSSGG